MFTSTKPKTGNSHTVVGLNKSAVSGSLTSDKNRGLENVHMPAINVKPSTAGTGASSKRRNNAAG